MIELKFYHRIKDDLILNLAQSTDVELIVQDTNRSHRLGIPNNGVFPGPRQFLRVFLPTLLFVKITVCCKTMSLAHIHFQKVPSFLSNKH